MKKWKRRSGFGLYTYFLKILNLQIILYSLVQTFHRFLPTLFARGRAPIYKNKNRVTFGHVPNLSNYPGLEKNFKIPHNLSKYSLNLRDLRGCEIVSDKIGNVTTMCCEDYATKLIGRNSGVATGAGATAPRAQRRDAKLITKKVILR